MRQKRGYNSSGDHMVFICALNILQYTIYYKLLNCLKFVFFLGYTTYDTHHSSPILLSQLISINLSDHFHTPLCAILLGLFPLALTPRPSSIKNVREPSVIPKPHRTNSMISWVSLRASSGGRSFGSGMGLSS